MKNLDKALEGNCPVCDGKDSRGLGPVGATSNYFLCNDCDLTYLHPQPKAEEIQNIYSAEYFKAWDASQSKNENLVRQLKRITFQRRLDLLARFCKLEKLLEIGSATGYFLEVAVERGINVVGVELSQYAAELAKKRVGIDRVFAGYLDDAPFAKEVFDVIAMMDVIEHLPNPKTFLQSLRERLMPKGKILITSPDTRSISARLFGRRWPHYSAEHLCLFNRESIEKIAKVTGYRVLYFAKSTKTMSLGYIFSQLIFHPPMPAAVPIFKLLFWLTPKFLKWRPMQVSFNGDFECLLEKVEA